MWSQLDINVLIALPDVRLIDKNYLRWSRHVSDGRFVTLDGGAAQEHLLILAP